MVYWFSMKIMSKRSCLLFILKGLEPLDSPPIYPTLVKSNRRYTPYSHQSVFLQSFVHKFDWTTEDLEKAANVYYFHCDQIGILREMTDKDGHLLWFKQQLYHWSSKEETKAMDMHTQPFPACKPICRPWDGCITTSSGIMSLMLGGL